MSRAELVPAGAAVQAWLDLNGKSQQWLAREMNARRLEAGITTRIQRSNLWRWMTGRQGINIDDATLIQQITAGPDPERPDPTRVLVTLWSVHAALKKPRTSRSPDPPTSAPRRGKRSAPIRTSPVPKATPRGKAA